MGEAVIIGALELRECVAQDFQANGIRIGDAWEMVALLLRRNGMDHIWLGSHRKVLYTGTMTIWEIGITCLTSSLQVPFQAGKKSLTAHYFKASVLESTLLRIFNANHSLWLRKSSTLSKAGTLGPFSFPYLSLIIFTRGVTDDTFLMACVEEIEVVSPSSVIFC